MSAAMPRNRRTRYQLPNNRHALGAKIGCDAFVKDIEGVAANGKTKLQQGRKT